MSVYREGIRDIAGIWPRGCGVGGGLLRALAAILFLSAVTVAQAASIESQRKNFLDAEAALKRGDRTGYERRLAALADYPLHPYLIHADLQGRLARLSAGEVHGFLEGHDDTLLADRLRDAWLEHLAKAGNWPLYLEFHRPDGSQSTECEYRQALLATGRRDQALQGFESIWLTGRSLPSACDAALAAWQAGSLTDELVWERLRLALEAGETGLAGYLKRMLPRHEQTWAGRWIDLHRKPEGLAAVNWKAGAHLRAGVILRHALIRLARLDPARAADLWAARKGGFGLDQAAADAVEREIALRMALRGMPEAGARLAALPARAFDSTLRQWQARRAIAEGDWTTVSRAIHSMDAADRADGTWRYWEARALEARGQTGAAKNLYATIAGERSFYGFLAAERINRPYRIAHRPIAHDERAIAAVAAQPTVRRAAELYALGRIIDARREWEHALRDLDNRGRELAAVIADRWGWHDRAIISAARAESWDDINLRFPIDHASLVSREAKRHEISPALAFAVIRQESAFMADVRSRAGALGLMQIMPSTARTIAPKAKVRYRGASALLDPAQNIRLGTWYLRDNLDLFGSHPALAAAAYNAGRNRVMTWLPETGEMAADAWIETIPFNETREYVKRVLSYRVLYEVRLGLPVTSLRELLAPIAPRGDLERLRLVHLRSLDNVPVSAR